LALERQKRSLAGAHVPGRNLLGFLRSCAVLDQAPLPVERMRHDAIEIVMDGAPAAHLTDAFGLGHQRRGSPGRRGPKRTAKSVPEARSTAAITSRTEKPLP